ncbi:hypothetical protein, partial [Vibrio parahaemolyticus]|uniref:hypothetical protein n=1 Tax=Vibrio parahaemolyticus TaxID=670 RepID=UPI001C5D26E3
TISSASPSLSDTLLATEIVLLTSVSSIVVDTALAVGIVFPGVESLTTTVIEPIALPPLPSETL